MKFIKFTFFIILIFLPIANWAMDIQEFKTKNGLKFWFVEDKSIPIISMSFTFLGGSFFDTKDKSGTANFLAALLDEGSGDLNGKEFQEKMNSLGMKLNFSSSKDKFSGFFQTISENRNESFNLLKSAIGNPSLDSESIEKIRGQIISGIKIAESNIQTQSSLNFYSEFFKGHKFSMDYNGTINSVTGIKKTDLENYLKNYISKSNLLISVSGNINKKELLSLIDETFGSLPTKSNERFKIPSKLSFPDGIKIVPKDTPQSAVVFGQKGISRNSKDFFAARIANYVLGGGGFQSKLYKKVRDERGLVYSIYSYLSQYENNPFIIGGFQTKNESVFETINLIKEEWRKIKDNGITLKELNEAKSYFQGSFSRNFTSTSSIASLLNTIQYHNLGLGYINERQKIIEDISLEEVNRVCFEIFDKDKLYFSVVGAPKK